MSTNETWERETVVLTSLVPRPPLFFILRFSFSIVYTEAEEREKQGRPGNTHHVNDVWWMQGGRRGGCCPSTNSRAINDRARFLPAKLSTVNLVNLRSPGYRWSTR